MREERVEALGRHPRILGGVNRASRRADHTVQIVEKAERGRALEGEVEGERDAWPGEGEKTV